MFGAKKLVLYITNGKIWVDSPGSITQKPVAYKWSGGDLTAHFKKIASKYKVRNFDIVAGESYSYVFVKDIPINEKKAIELSDAAGIIPNVVSVNNTKWSIIDTDEKKNIQWVEFVSISQTLLDSLNSIKIPDVTISNIYPIAKLIAKKYVDEKSPNLILWTGFETVALVSYKGIVYLSSITVGSKEGEIEAIIDQSKVDFGIKLKTYISNSKERTQKIKLPKSWKVKVESFYPLTLISKLKDKDSGMVFPVSGNIASEPSKEDNETQDEDGGRSKKDFLLIALTSTVIVASIAGGIIYWRSISNPTPKGNPERTVEIVDPTGAVVELKDDEPGESTESASIEESIDYTDYIVEVQNGAGVAGVASEVAQLLEDIGFVEVQTGNADNFEYSGITILYKEEVPQNLVKSVVEQFPDDNVVVDEELLLIGDEVDIRVIVGSS